MLWSFRRSEHPKDPGIPNSFPYKDQILAEVAEQRRQVSVMPFTYIFRTSQTEFVLGSRGEAPKGRAEEGREGCCEDL